MLRKTGTTHIPDPMPPGKLASEPPTPKTDAEANSGFCQRHCHGARMKKVTGLREAGTFMEMQPGE